VSCTFFARDSSLNVQDNHFPACNCQIVTDFTIFFTDRLDNKHVIIWLLTTPPHLKYVATLACNISLIACFPTLMFRKVLWQHLQGVLGFF